MSDSTRQEILAEIISRLEGIRRTAGYQTDIGARVVIGEVPVFSEGDEEQWLSVEPSDSDINHSMENVGAEWIVEVQAMSRADAESPWLTIEALIADVCKAIENDSDGETDRDLGGLCIEIRKASDRIIKREAGSDYVGAAVGYRILFGRPWGTP